MSRKLNNQTHQALNFPSRLTLVKAVLQAMLSYVFSVLSTPKVLIKKIWEIQRIFLWGSMEIKQKWALVDWEMMCKPKHVGGLQLRDPKITNKVLSAKIWWRWVTNKQEPWVTLWHQKYAQGWPNQNLIHFDQEITGSPIWQVANANKRLVKMHSFQEIGNGEEVDFFRDSWKQLIQEEVDLPNMQAQLEREGLTKVKDFWVNNGEVSLFRQWRPEEWFVGKIPREEMQGLVQILEECKLDIRASSDMICWGYRTPGQFNVKEAAYLASGSTNLPAKKRWCKLWGQGHWPKITLFLWILTRGRILTWENLRRRGMLGPSVCVMCHKAEETNRHLLQGCERAKEV